jgi:hypothetical protein
MVINDPAVVRELTELYPRYESALVNNDVETLIAMFWASPHTVRFGATENLHGIDEIVAFRKGRSPANLARTIDRLDIAAFGNDLGEVSLEFSRLTDNGAVRGRQSQTWVRFPEGWRIVAAHVSILPTTVPSTPTL